MIYYNNNLSKKLININCSNFIVVADFDRTLTQDDSSSTWSIMADSNLLSPSYKVEYKILFDKYRPLELDTSLTEIIRGSYMNEWWRKHIKLILQNNLTVSKIKSVSNNIYFKYRAGVKAYFNYLNENNIPVIILSAGIGEMIKISLQSEGMLLKNINLISNFFSYNSNNVAIKIKNKNLIHSSNKNEVSFPNKLKFLENISNVFLFGDSIDDIKMVDSQKHNNIIKVGFLTDKKNLEAYKKMFDIVCTDNASFDELNDSLFNNFNFCLYKKNKIYTEEINNTLNTINY